MTNPRQLWVLSGIRCPQMPEDMAGQAGGCTSQTMETGHGRGGSKVGPGYGDASFKSKSSPSRNSKAVARVLLVAKVLVLGASGTGVASRATCTGSVKTPERSEQLLQSGPQHLAMSTKGLDPCISAPSGKLLGWGCILASAVRAEGQP